MTIQKVPAGTGWHWIAQAFDTLKRWPLAFLLMGVTYAVIANIKYLGALVVFILGPALLGGIVYATRASQRGGTPVWSDLWHAFQDSDRTGPMIALCLPRVIGVIIVGIVFAIFLIGAMLSAGLTAADMQNPMLLMRTLGGGAAIVIPIVIVALLIVEAMTFFAISRVLLDHSDAFAAMKESFQASWRNAGAFLLALLSLVIGAAILGWILRLLHLGWFGSVITDTLYYAMTGATLYFAWHDVFARDAEAAPAAPATAAPPAGVAASAPEVPPPASAAPVVPPQPGSPPI